MLKLVLKVMAPLFFKERKRLKRWCKHLKELLLRNIGHKPSFIMFLSLCTVWNRLLDKPWGRRYIVVVPERSVISGKADSSVIR